MDFPAHRCLSGERKWRSAGERASAGRECGEETNGDVSSPKGLSDKQLICCNCLASGLVLLSTANRGENDFLG